MTENGAPSTPPRATRDGGLGTFGGVFTPSLLTILGIVLFLRVGLVVGGSGLRSALAMVLLAHVVSITTSLSLAAIATNRRVQGGGDYYLISRSLGLEYGGALGLLLFGAQAVSVGFYCFGFGEAVSSLLPAGPFFTSRSLAIGAALLLFGIAYLGADLATRFQYVIMAVIALALVSFVAGSAGEWHLVTLEENWAYPRGDGLPFWGAFAIFFPAVTGFTQGVSMSGDLKDPGKSLPWGTFAAVLLSMAVYLGVVLLFGGTMTLGELRMDPFALKRGSLVPALADAGVVAATLSSALASFLGAPRILQALAADRVFPALAPFAVGHGPAANPRRGIVLTAAVALMVLAAGSLDAVARIISMFFLISYGLLNYATFVEAHGASPSFRPRFRFFSARLAALGALCCFGSMLAVGPLAGLAALLVLAGLYQYLKRTGVPAQWADSRRAYRFRILKDTLRAIDRHPESEWTWQPHVLAVSQVRERRDLVIRFATWISGSVGLTTAVSITEGQGDSEVALERKTEDEREMAQELKEQRIDAFSLALAAPDVRVALTTLLQTWGIGTVHANTVLFDWYEVIPEESRMADPRWYARALRGMARLGAHVAVVDVAGKEWRRVEAVPAEDRVIDVWWIEGPSSRLCLLFAYLMTRADEWRDATLRVLAPVRAEEDLKLENRIRQMLEAARIAADVVVVRDGDHQELCLRSHESSVVLLPFTLEGMAIQSPFGGELAAFIEELPITCLVAAARDIRLTEIVEEPPKPEKPAPEKPAPEEAAPEEAAPEEAAPS